VNDYPEPFNGDERLKGRSILVKKARPLQIECIVRGYLSGSGWKEYLQKGSISGINLPAGLKESDRLPKPIFTPSTKAELGQHDLNIDLFTAGDLVGHGLIEEHGQQPAVGHALPAAEVLRNRALRLRPPRLRVFEYETQAAFPQDFCCDRPFLPEQAEQQMLCADMLVGQTLGFLRDSVQNALALVGKGKINGSRTFSRIRVRPSISLRMLSIELPVFGKNRLVRFLSSRIKPSNRCSVSMYGLPNWLAS
jgi:hypothetical protein